MANEVVLVPIYPSGDPAMDRAAIELYRRLLPRRRVVAIDAESLIARNGSLHCIAVGIPAPSCASGHEALHP